MITARPADSSQQPLDGFAEVSPTIKAPIDRHFYVPDVADSYCLACSLPRRNQRHVARAA